MGIWQTRTVGALMAVVAACAGVEVSEQDDEDECWGNCGGQPVDILFVIDGSSSMADEASMLLRDANALFGPDTNHRVAITTASMDANDAWSLDPEGGETGLFVGDEGFQVVRSDDANAVHQFKQNLGCWAACWNGAAMPSNSSYIGTTGDCPFPDSNGDGVVDNNDEATTQYLDCMCTDVGYPEGEDWDAIELCRAGNELHLESTLMALCRAADEPPDVCYHTKDVTDFPFQDDWIGSNTDWLRPDSTVVVVFVTDEGDQSEAVLGGLFSGNEDDPQVYIDAFEQFERPIRFAAIGPDLVCEGETNCSFTCNSGGASATGVRRLRKLTAATGGFYNPITTGSGDDCTVSNFKAHLRDLNQLLAEL